MSSTRCRSCALSPWMRARASRYPAASRGVLSATSVSARITLSGVRSSCEASAVNSSWRRRDCSTGASARWPTARQPKNMASRTNGPASTSAYSSRRLVCATPARLWPATSQPVPSRVIFSRNGPARPALTVTARPSRGCWPPSGRVGNAGAPGLCAVTACRAPNSQKKTGAESASLSPAPRNVRGARWLNTSGSRPAAARRSAIRLSFCWASRAETTRLSTMTPRT